MILNKYYKDNNLNVILVYVKPRLTLVKIFYLNHDCIYKTYSMTIYLQIYLKVKNALR